jgi:hypothetical protein
MERRGLWGLTLVLVSGVLGLWPASTSAIPAFARRYGLACSVCHVAWPVLNEFGEDFRMSGYRRFAGQALAPTTPDLDLLQGTLTIPAIPPVAFRADFGFDFQQVRRQAVDGSHATRTGSSFDLNELELLAGTPLGQHLSFFLQYDLFETEIERPTGPGEANETATRKNITFETEGPRVPGMAKLLWNSLLPQSLAPLDSLNLIGGVNELPVAFSPEHRRLSASPYLIYERRAVDLLSGKPVDDLLPEEVGRRLFRLSEEQIGVELNGALRPGGAPGPLRLEYHLGVTNGSNKDSDPNTEKDLFGRMALRWRGQTLGVFGYWSPDIYSDDLRASAAIASGGILSGRGHNTTSSVGPDLTLNLQPFAIPVWLDNQFLFNHESNPTGFNRHFTWWGGFSQLNWKPFDSLIAYGRYDWLHGDRFDDTDVGGVTGPVRPREWAAVVGLQWYALVNLRLIAEYSRHQFTNNASSPSHQKVEDDFFTLRAALAF